MLKLWICVSLSAVGCGVSEPTSRIDINEPNELGVVALSSEQRVDNGDHLYLLEGLDAGGSVVARLQQRIGHIADLNAHLPGDDDVGTEQIIAIGDQQWRGITRETHVHTVPLFEPSTRYREFFLLDAVRTELAEHQTVVGFSRAARIDNDRPLYTNQCGSVLLNVTPVATQCCTSVFTPYPEDPQSTQRYTEFKPASGNNANLIVRREISPYGPCKSYYGGACSGQSCFYGPNGSSTATVYTFTQNWAVVVMSQYDDESCGPQEGGTPDYGDVVGSFPTGQGCPGGNEAWGFWDY